MRRKRVLFLLIVCLVIIAASNSLAGRVWYYQEVITSDGPVGNGTEATAIGMRSGGVWPVVAYQYSTAAMLPGTWIESPGGFSGEIIDGATGSNGDILFADNFGSIKMLTGDGYVNASYGGMSNHKPSAAFNNNSEAAVLHNGENNDELCLTMQSGDSWYTTAVEDNGNPINSDYYALAFDSYNQAFAVFEEGSSFRTATKGVMTGNEWVVSDIVNGVHISGALDMTLSSNDVPYVAYVDNGHLKACSYDVHSGSWMFSSLDYIGSDNFCMATDGEGGVGLAYVTDNDMLKFIFNDGSGWRLGEELTAADYHTQVGLAFDDEDNPVISYGNGGDVWIAYDPVVVPEPATLGLLLIGGIMAGRKRG